MWPATFATLRSFVRELIERGEGCEKSGEKLSRSRCAVEVGEAAGALGPELADEGEEVFHAGVVPPGRGQVQRSVAETSPEVGSGPPQ